MPLDSSVLPILSQNLKLAYIGSKEQPGVVTENLDSMNDLAKFDDVLDYLTNDKQDKTE
jgi:hypothetical protein